MKAFATKRKTVRALACFAVALSLLTGGCFRSQQGEKYFGKVVVPASQEFRWSDGGLPRVFDPARAAAPPDTDAVRALYEGLTEYGRGTMSPEPAVASRWESSEGGRRWTFHLRAAARWSNGDPVTANDFVRSWRRTLRLGERAPHSKLLSNIEGSEALAAAQAPQEGEGADTDTLNDQQSSPPSRPAQKGSAAKEFGVVALDAHTLRVTLRRPDENFPALVAHPVFRPVHELNPGAGLAELRDEQIQPGGERTELGIVTNGAFSLSRLGGDRVELKRAASYWDATSVKLEKVFFVDKSDTESALAAYRTGEVDAVTNAPVEPLAVKLLTPYKDFRRGVYAALNYYRFNTARPPFDDRRVREALARALDVERISSDTLGGSTDPASGFLPRFGRGMGEAVAASVDAGERAGALGYNVEHARSLLAEAGYPGGENFPRIRLLINRNEQQRLVAQAVARMWRDALGVETEVIARDWEEYEAMLRAGDYDLARRSLVMQTSDEATNMLELFSDETHVEVASGETEASPSDPSSTPAPDGASQSPGEEAWREPQILSEAQALRELPAIPLHFASSYALVKPYVDGFENNLLDAPSLKKVSINTAWRDPSVPTPATVAPSRRP